MALTRITTGVQQTTPFECGAASCLYILQMLGTAKAGKSVSDVMSKTSTWGPIPLVGSSPANIAGYIRHRCATRAAGLTVQRIGGSSPWMRPWIHSLRPAISGYAKFAGVLGADDAVLRFITPADPAITSHFVVETHLGRQGCEIMDPTDGGLHDMAFQDYLNWKGMQTTGLDLVFSG